MVGSSRQQWIAVAVLPGLWLSSVGTSCAPDHPEGEIACAGADTTATCPSFAPVCERRRGDDVAYCYRSTQAAGQPNTLALRIAETDVAKREAAQRANAPTSPRFRLVDQSIATQHRQLLATGR